MSDWISIGEAKRLEEPEWENTVKDLCDLMGNYRTAPTVGKQQEFAARAISFVMSNLERRGLIEDQFMDLAAATSEKGNRIV